MRGCCDIFCPCFKACGEWIGVGGGGRETHKEVVVICQGETEQTGTRRGTGVAMPVGSEFTQATQFRSPPAGMSSYIICPCRSMKLVYKEQGVFGGIPTFRFVAPSTLFANGSVYPPNEGFCPCRESGIQNVSTCRFSTCRPCGRAGGGARAGGLVCLFNAWPLYL